MTDKPGIEVGRGWVGWELGGGGWGSDTRFRVARGGCLKNEVSAINHVRDPLKVLTVKSRLTCAAVLISF